MEICGQMLLLYLYRCERSTSILIYALQVLTTRVSFVAKRCGIIVTCYFKYKKTEDVATAVTEFEDKLRRSGVLVACIVGFVLCREDLGKPSRPSRFPLDGDGTLGLLRAVLSPASLAAPSVFTFLVIENIL